MRKLFNALLAVLFFAAELGAQTVTPNLGLTLPAAQLGSWGAAYNNNFLILDTASLGGTGGAPLDLDYLTRSASGLVSGERVVTDTPTISWDWATAGQAKPGIVANSVGPAQIDETGDYTFDGTVFLPTVIASLGSGAPANRFKIVTDATGSSCTVAGGSTRVLCLSDGVGWNPIGSGVEIDTLALVCARGCSFTGANSFATGMHIGESATVGYRIYSHPTNGPTISCVVAGVENDCDHVINIGTGKSLIYKFNGTEAERVTAANVHTYAATFRPKKSIGLPASYFSTDGTQCVTAAEAILAASKPKTWTITCTDNDAGRIEAAFPTPAAWDGLTIRVKPYWFSTTAQTGNIVQSWSGQCVRDGDPVANVATTGEQVATIAMGNQAADEQSAWSAAITLQGTCAGGATIYLTGDIDATLTTIATMANARFLRAMVEYSVSSRSD